MIGSVQYIKFQGLNPDGTVFLRTDQIAGIYPTPDEEKCIIHTPHGDVLVFGTMTHFQSIFESVFGSEIDAVPEKE